MCFIIKYLLIFIMFSYLITFFNKKFSLSERNGRGEFTFANGDSYVGESKDGKRNGQNYSFSI